MKKFRIIIICIIITLIVFLGLGCSVILIKNYLTYGSFSDQGTANIINLSWDLNLPKEETIEDILTYKSRKGTSFRILKYKSQKELIESNPFSKITEKNQNKINEILNVYYNNLSDNEKQLYNTKVSESIISKGNFYIYREDHYNHYVLLILNSKTNDLYYFLVNEEYDVILNHKIK